MDIQEAQKIYEHPNGHTKQELTDCINTLNNAAQPIRLNSLQYAAIQDAISRVSGECPRIGGE